MNELGPRIRKLRDDVGLTQRQLAKKLRVTQPAVDHWENGRVSPLMSRLPKIAKALGVTVERLMFGDLEKAA